MGGVHHLALASALANERRKNGRDKPWKIDYVGVGNEPWGCGGDMRPEYYADEYKKYALNIKTPRDSHPSKWRAARTATATSGPKCS